jgi:hypothetical protein
MVRLCGQLGRTVFFLADIDRQVGAKPSLVCYVNSSKKNAT